MVRGAAETAVVSIEQVLVKAPTSLMGKEYVKDTSTACRVTGLTVLWALLLYTELRDLLRYAVLLGCTEWWDWRSTEFLDLLSSTVLLEWRRCTELLDLLRRRIDLDHRLRTPATF